MIRIVYSSIIPQSMASEAYVARLRPRSTFLISEWHGAFGNNLHQYAFACTYASKHSARVVFPEMNVLQHIFRSPPSLHVYVAEAVQCSTTGDIQSVANAVNVSCSMNATKHTLQEFVRLYKPSSWHVAIVDYPGHWLAGHATKRAKVTWDAYAPPHEHIQPVHKHANSARSTKDSSLVKNLVCCDLTAYSTSAFRGMDAHWLRKELFSWSDNVKSLCVFHKWNTLRGTYMAAHVRRGDCPVHISLASYTTTIKHIKRDSKSTQNMETVWLSDDHSVDSVSTAFTSGTYSYLGGTGDYYCPVLGWKRTDGSWWKPPDWYWRGHVDGLEALIAMTFARVLVRGNSSFSFWAGLMIHDGGDVWSPDMSGVDTLELDDDHMIVEQENTGRVCDVPFVNGNRPHWYAGMREPWNTPVCEIPHMK